MSSFYKKATLSASLYNPPPCLGINILPSLFCLLISVLSFPPQVYSPLCGVATHILVGMVMDHLKWEIASLKLQNTFKAKDSWKDVIVS